MSQQNTILTSNTLNLCKKFYVYVDFTCEAEPRPFYVGKGLLERTEDFKRNRRHAEISAKFGVSRKIIFETEDEAEAFEKERVTIAELHTYVCDDNYNNVGCNLTKGGNGYSGGNNKPIHQFDLNGNFIKTYPSLETAAKVNNVKMGLLSAIVGGRRKTLELGGFLWKVDVENSKKRKPNKRTINAKAILQLNLSDKNVVCEHASVKAAAKIADVHRLLMSRFLRKNLTRKDQIWLMNRPNINIHKYVWVFKNFDDEQRNTNPHHSLETRECLSKACKGVKRSVETCNKLSLSRSVPVQKISLTGDVLTVYPSAKVAVKVEIGTSKSGLLNAVHKGVQYKGYFWKRELVVKT